MSNDSAPALETRLDLSIVWPPRNNANSSTGVSAPMTNDVGAQILSVDPAVHIEMGRRWKYLGTGMATSVSLKEFSGALVGRFSGPLSTDPIVCEIQTAVLTGIGAFAARGVPTMPAFKIDWAEANILLGVEVVFAITLNASGYTAFIFNHSSYWASTPGIFPYRLLLGFRMDAIWPVDSKASREDVRFHPVIGFESIF